MDEAPLCAGPQKPDPDYRSYGLINHHVARCDGLRRNVKDFVALWFKCMKRVGCLGGVGISMYRTWLPVQERSGTDRSCRRLFFSMEKHLKLTRTI